MQVSLSAYTIPTHDLHDELVTSKLLPAAHEMQVFLSGATVPSHGLHFNVGTS